MLPLRRDQIFKGKSYFHKPIPPQAVDIVKAKKTAKAIKSTTAATK
jgi:hypothetical protein